MGGQFSPGLGATQKVSRAFGKKRDILLIKEKGYGLTFKDLKEPGFFREFENFGELGGICEKVGKPFQ